MPQFDTSVFMGQIFWLVLSFGVLYLGVAFIVFPLFRQIFAAREKLIQTPLDKAEKITFETQKILEEQEKKKKAAETRYETRLNEAYKTAAQQMNGHIQEREKQLNDALKRSIRKMENEERRLFQNKDDFIHQLMKGLK